MREGGKGGREDGEGERKVRREGKVDRERRGRGKGYSVGQETQEWLEADESGR